MGVERTWDYLKTEFKRQGDAIPNPTVRYFETIGAGPAPFAADSSYVYYHDQGKWWKYKSAFDIVFDTMDIPD